MAKNAPPNPYAIKVTRPPAFTPLGGKRVPQPEPVISPEVVDDAAFKQAVGAFAKAVFQEDGDLLKSFLGGNSGKKPGSNWNNQGSVNTALISRVTANLAASYQRTPEQVEEALAENGLSWGPPFPPGRPLDPFYGYKRPPRTWDFSVGENVQLTPRWNRTSFGTLKAIVESYYAAQVCVRHLINDVRSLDYQFIPPQNVLEDATEDLQAAEAFFNSPDKRQPFRAWLAEYLQDVLRYDAGALYVRRNEAGDPIALEVVSGATIIPLIDFFGRPPVDENDTDAYPDGIWNGEITPAFVQIVEGMPWVWLTKEDLIYQPLNPLPESQYGLAPMEAVLMQANTDIRFQWHFLQYFTEGSIPAGFMEAPPDLSDPVQVQEWQETWDAVMLGDQSKLRQVRWVPAGAEFKAVKNSDFDDSFPLYLMRCTAAAFGVTPNDLGFTEDVNRSTGETQVNIQFRVGTLPVVRHVEDVINLFITEHLGLRARIAFDTGQGTSHRLETAQANDIYVKNGTLSQDEVRISLGRRISREHPAPRFVDNTRNGPVPLLAIESLAGKIDPTTFGPHKDQDFIDHPFLPIPGVLPVQGSQEQKDSANAAANMQRNMLIQNDDNRAPGQARSSAGVLTEQTESAGPEEADTPEKIKSTPEMATKAALFDALVELLKEGVDNTGGPGLGKDGPGGVMSSPSGATGNSPVGGTGITVGTGLQGVDLDHGKKRKRKKAKKCNPNVAVAKAEETFTDIRRWKENSLNRMRKGLPPRKFDDLPPMVTDSIWPRLQTAKTREDVLAAFGGDPLGQVDHSGRIVLPPNTGLQYGDRVQISLMKDNRVVLNREAAGICVQAKDTGRVLMIQRVAHKHDDDDTDARWEWPGGKLDGGGDGNYDPSVWAGALREWHEETGAVMPDGVEPVGGWVSDDGVYEGFIVRIPSESDLELDPQPSEASAAGWWLPDDLTEDQIRQKVHDQLPDILPMLAMGEN